MIKIISEIKFPIYGITKKYRRLWNENNVLFIETESGIYVIDNKNIPGKTLGTRRLRLKADKYRLKKIILNAEQLLRSKYIHFIDSLGTLFEYKRTTMVPLKYHEVINSTIYENKIVLDLKGVSYRPVLRHKPDAYGIKYVGLLHTSMGLIPYEYSTTYKKDTRRKI